ncbi:MAG: YbaB/EbfC family nucleoid-associated protein [Oligoflexia bacterium]|nr:YbaB/EbfC family nucleoid-associated protein [Oligoflexia bacterium]
MKRGGGFGFGNMQQLMQQAQQMQKKMETVQAELASKQVEASSGGGAVKVVLTGKQELVELTIAPEALDGADAEMLSDMVKAAFTEALKKSKDLHSEMMGGAFGGSVPPGFL